ncbi:DUF397 domain-containing protein [Streptomyces sp. NPDC091281]|uniref:DUF397 domain-containing protein n=1 Tax=Streptomyces sp. NPDC091281 TaxID=3365985 RepID=UPI0037F2A667
MEYIDLSRATWRRSSYSSGNGQCVEVAFAHGTVAVRDSKNTSGPSLAVPSSAFDALVQGISDGAFDTA